MQKWCSLTKGHKQGIEALEIYVTHVTEAYRTHFSSVHSLARFLTFSKFINFFSILSLTHFNSRLFLIWVTINFNFWFFFSFKDWIFNQNRRRFIKVLFRVQVLAFTRNRFRRRCYNYRFESDLIRVGWVRWRGVYYTCLHCCYD